MHRNAISYGLMPSQIAVEMFPLNCGFIRQREGKNLNREPSDVKT